MRHFTASILCAIVLLLVPPSIWAASPEIPLHSDQVVLPGHVLSALSMAQPVAAPAMALKRASKPLTLTIVLRRSDPAGFENFLHDVYDPQSPQFREFLSPRETSDRFGPSQDDYDTVQAYFEQQGFTVTEGSENRMTLTVAGTRSTAESALSVKINDYVLGERQFFANDNEPILPAELATRVQAVTGLSNLARPRPIAIMKWLKEQPCKEEGDTAGYLKKQVLQNGYQACINAVNSCSSRQNLTADEVSDVLKVCSKFNPNSPANSPQVRSSAAKAQPLAVVAWKNASGAGQKIGLLQFDSFVPSDVSDFLDFFGMPSTVFSNLSQVHVNGGAALGPDQREVLLDIDTVLLNAPDAQVVVYDAPFSGGGSFQSLFNRAINDGMTIISNSWTYCEDQTTLADVEGIDSILAAAAAAGVSVFNASGDSGSTCLDGSPNTIGVPAGSPHAAAVGGTSQITGPTAVYESETWWNGLTNTPPTGQGGFGVSRFFARPAYQDGFTSSPMRSIPDVAFNADPAQGTIICQASAGGCPAPFFIGGTSMAAPAWAAAAAILNQVQGHNLGNLNLSLYPLASTNAFHSAASMGSDFAHVGLGSPNLNKLHLALTSSTAGAVSASESNMRIVSSTAPADDVSAPFVVVRLRDSAGNAISGKVVTLAANSGSHAVISPASGISTVDNGAVVFSVTNSTVEDVTFTATDATDNIVLQQQTSISFVVPPAASASISASPTGLLNDGTSTTTITVTLKDALNRPTPDKLITLSQGSGRSIITGPNPSVTDANGQIQFTATNQVSETVTYTAVDVTDGDLPVPGNATVTFSGSANSSCVGSPPTAAAGYTLTPFANGFAARNFFFGNVNWGGCPGASNPAFDTAGSVFAADFPDGGLFRMGSQGGVVSNANQIANLGPTLGQPVFGKDGSLYLSRSVTTGGSSSGDIVQVDPINGSVIRTVVSGLTCPAGLSVDPLSGDLFFDNQCFGASTENASLYRVRNPASASPTLEVYATLPATPNGAISFAPDGALYVVSGYLDPNAPVLKIGGTNSSPTITQTGVTSSYWVTVGEAQANGAAKSLIVLSGGAANPTLSLVDLTTNPITSTPLVNGGIGSGVIGPDGCLYVSASDSIYKLAPSSGGCGFATTNPAPALLLSPATVSPDPAQGLEQTMTAQFINQATPAETPVFFNITGANAQTKLGRTDASGKATIRYTGTFTGNDTVIASATLGATDFTSNQARLTWGAGQHVTFLSLNTSPSGATVGVPLTLTAALVDVSVNPNAAIAGATIQFSVGGQSCSGVTNASGVASCSVTLPATGSFTLTANFAGGAQQQAAAASQAFFVAAPVASPPTCFTGALTSGGQATACLTSALPACQFTNSAFVSVASAGVAPPAGIQIPYGLFQFATTGCSDTVTLSVSYPNALPANASYWKFGPTAGQPAHWYALPATVNGNTLTVTLTDGGAGDSDLQQNGSIVDPGGAGFAVGAGGAPIPTLDEWRLLLFVLLMAAMLSVAAPRLRRTGRF